ncbi:unnamed protein product [Durusdinium trenchii]|uniref:Acyltransferase C-terminal domain-containing protein n=1 Tax=Durusdinium trenchii TaxID=1381693 RepID=A0ABP0M537_9DINO
MQLDNVYDITVVEGPDSGKANVLTLAQGIPAEFHVFIEKIAPNDIPKDEDTFTSWLMGRWQAKDARIARYQKDQQFMDATGAPAQRHLLSVDPRCAQTTYCAMLWWLLSSLFFFQHCVRYGRYRLLLGTGLGTLLLVALIGVVIQRALTSAQSRNPNTKVMRIRRRWKVFYIEIGLGFGAMTASPDQGVFSSRAAVAAQSREDLLRLTYTTTTGSSYLGKQFERGERPESFQEIFEVGQRRTKYLGVPLRLAPLLDRSSCNYTMDFAKKPLGDHLQNSHMAKHFKAGTKPQNGLPNLPTAKSTYSGWGGSSREGSVQQLQCIQTGHSHSHDGCTPLLLPQAQNGLPG